MPPLLRPVLHPEALGWDELALVVVGLIGLILIATTGGKAEQAPTEPDQSPPPDES